MTGPSAVPLYPYQQRWFLDRSRFKIGMFARQTGKTFTTTLEIVDDVHEAMTTGRRTRWVILSRGERQAKEAMETGIKPHSKAYGAALEELEYDWVGAAGTYRAFEVEYPDGSRITVLPANPDTARGFSANVFLDEFAIHRDSRAIWTALFPVISAGWKLRITSTPKGKDNKFYELMTGKDSRWSRHTVDIHQAVADGLPRDVAELREALNDEDAWAQEFECQWLDEASAWLPYELICAVEHERAGDPDRYEGNPVFIGNDIAARNDLWVAWVWEPVGDVLWTREIVVLRRASFAEQDRVMDELFRRYRVARLAMDQTGMGEKPVEDAKKRYGASRVEGVLFTAPAKLALATAGKQAFEDRTVRIPEGDMVLRADLHKLKKIVGPTGIPRFVAEADGAGHADRTWAAFLGIAAADTGLQPPAGEEVMAAADTYRPAAMADRPALQMFRRAAASLFPRRQA
jgi:phage FluMu gp28-like protein